MEILETDVNMVEQNGKHDSKEETALTSEDIFKSSSSNLSTKSSKQSKQKDSLSQQNSSEEKSEDIVIEE